MFETFLSNVSADSILVFHFARRIRCYYNTEMFQTEFGNKSSPATDLRRCIYLALSGGGFRATAYHMGVILAYLAYNQHQSLCVVNGVSGGSIAAAHFGNWLNNWRDANAPKAGIEALRDFAS